MADSGDQEPVSNKELSDDILKEWTVEAKKGSEKHQHKLGIHYLKLAELNIDREINAEKAVTWLIGASKQGHVEATEKLRHCVQTNLGMNEGNKSDVTWCLNTSRSEKKIRYAAKSLYYKINSAQKGILSKEEYTEAINKLTVGHEKERKLLLATGRKIGTVVSENDFVKVLSKKINGTLTLNVDEMGETNAAYDSASFFQKVYLYPRQTASLAVDRGLEYASKEGMRLIISLIPTHQLYLLTLLFLYSYITPGFLVMAVPLLALSISFLVMLISTLQMFYKRRKQKDAATLAVMLQEQFDVDIDLENTESQYSWNSLTPYFVYFSTLPIMVISFSLANKSYVPCAELFIIGIIMTGFCFIGLSDSNDSATLLALGSHAFASLPVFLASLPAIPVLTKLVEFVTQPFFSLYLGFNISFNLSLPSIVYLLVPLLFLRMAMKGSWSGVYKILIPHVVCYFWFSFATSVFPFTTWAGLIRATVGYMLLPVFIPLSFVAAMIGIPYSIYKLLQTAVVGKLIVTGLLLAIPLVLTQTKTFFGNTDKKKASPKEQKIRRIVTIVFAVLSVIPLLYVKIPTFLDNKRVALSWQDYKYLCIPRDNLWARYQTRCQDFVGTNIHWKGTVKQIAVSKIENTAESFITSLPALFSEPLYCIYGERIPECDEQTMSGEEFKKCQLLTAAGRTCHLNSHNQISLSLTVSVDEYVVLIDAGPNFESGLKQLDLLDEIEFMGVLTIVGTPSPRLKLRSMSCVNRDLAVEMDVDDDLTGHKFFKLLNDAVALLFNFGFFPVLEYSH
jgi:wolfamin